MAGARADTSRRRKPSPPTIPGPCNDTDGRKETAHRRRRSRHRFQEGTISPMEEGVKLMEGEEGANTSPPGGGGRGESNVCLLSAFSTPIPLTHDPRFRNPPHNNPHPHRTRRPIDAMAHRRPKRRDIRTQAVQQPAINLDKNTAVPIVSSEREGPGRRQQRLGVNDLEWFHDARPTSTRRRSRETDQQSHSSHIHHMSFPPTRFSTDT